MATTIRQNAPVRITGTQEKLATINARIPSSVAISPILIDPPKMPIYPQPVEIIREHEYPNLKGKAYLDHAGTQIPAKSALESFSDDLIKNLYGNPHSSSSPSALAGHRVDSVRESMLHFFGADPAEFDLIFVANATAGIKLVMECFRDYCATITHSIAPQARIPKLLRKRENGGGLHYFYHRDSHTSLVGIREISSKSYCFKNDTEVEQWISSPPASAPSITLFAFPGQSNLTGRRLPLSWPSQIRSSGHHERVYTLLDAAALATTTPLFLSKVKPDFTCVSFYKIFGFPDLGALIVRKSTASQIMLSRKYFGGGTVEFVVSLDDMWHAKKSDSLHDRLEDGTLAFHQIIALEHALNVHNKLYGGMHNVSEHTACLTKELYSSLKALRHTNGVRMIEIYNDRTAQYGDPRTQGATVSFNVVRPDGSHIGYIDVEKAADAANIFLRSGTHCNPGGFATYLKWSAAEMRMAYRHGHRCSKPIQSVYSRTTGLVRASMGACSTSGDVQELVAFLTATYKDRNIRETGQVDTVESPLSNGETPAPSSSPTTANVTALPMLTNKDSLVCPDINRCEIAASEVRPVISTLRDANPKPSSPATTVCEGNSVTRRTRMFSSCLGPVRSHRLRSLGRIKREAKSVADMVKAGLSA